MQAHTPTAALFFAVALPLFVLGLSSEGVVQLRDTDFFEKLNFWRDRDGLPWIIHFGVPWCRHCINAMQVFDRLAESPELAVHFARVDCSEYPNLCSAFQVNKFPTVVMIDKDQYYTLDKPIQVKEMREFARKVDMGEANLIPNRRSIRTGFLANTAYYLSMKIFYPLFSPVYDLIMANIIPSLICGAITSFIFGIMIGRLSSALASENDSMNEAIELTEAIMNDSHTRKAPKPKAD
eukprot:TRINITY_DN10394_c0_g1_i1.p1 TRINITY_DN10394_c0_g1~~TRINITY_DN10394_c0_g1_i1.p1  ORF type:complete len:237 (+),score=51.31 TRINITY_DN10394_c0_g1_i1:44-754(+)